MPRLHDLSIGHDRHAVIRNLDAHFAPGSMTAIVGPNGAGKSTLLRTLAGELRPLAGRIEGLRGRPAWLPQQAAVDRSFPIDVHAFAAMGLWTRLGAFAGLTRRHRAWVDDALAVVGIADLAARPIGALSGGQMQRVLFARLWLQDARVILLDEPFNAIDATTEADLLALIRQWNAEGRTVLAVLHDLQLVRRHFPDTLLLAATGIAHGPTAQVLPARHPGGRETAFPAAAGGRA